MRVFPLPLVHAMTPEKRTAVEQTPGPSVQGESEKKFTEKRP
jgi:hypothetical protein